MPDNVVLVDDDIPLIEGVRVALRHVLLNNGIWQVTKETVPTEAINDEEWI